MLLVVMVGAVLLPHKVAIVKGEEITYREESLEESVSEFTDDFIQQEMEEYKIPGAAVAIMKDGKVVYEKAYGYSDAKTKQAFTVDTTTFRIASITKVFTMTALMQLVEEGKVDLDEEIFMYLPTLKLNNPYDKNPTVRDLLTHTSGIDSNIIGDLSHEKVNYYKEHYLISEINKKNLTVTTQPGKYISYCSYGTVLAGCIVEEVSGMNCEAYIRKNILEPLQMNNTVMGLENANLSKGYISNGRGIQEESLDGDFILYPEGGLISSVKDMEKFILSYLTTVTGNEENNDIENLDLDILQNDTINEIESTQIRYASILPGMCLGFAEHNISGKRVIGHAGYSPDGFCSQMDIYPDEGIATFIVVNQGSDNYITEDFQKAFVTKYMLRDLDSNLANDFKYNDDKYSESNEAKNKNNFSTKDVKGTYRFSDYSKTTLCKGDVFGGITEITIKPIDDTTIQISGYEEYTGKQYTKEAVMKDGVTYEVKDSYEYLVFHEENGKITTVADSDSSSHGYYEKLHWYESGKVQMPIFIVGMALFIVYIIFLLLRSVIGIIIKKRNKSLLYKKTKLQKWKEFIMATISLMDTGFFVYSMTRWGTRLHYTVPIDVKINLCMPIIGSIGAIVLIPLIIMEWYRKEKSIGLRVFDTVFGIASIVYVGFFLYFNMLGFHY